MNEILLLLLGFMGVFAVGCSIALLALGKMIDQFPAGDETKRARSIASPIETTKLSIVLFWVFFVVGGWALLQENRYRDDCGYYHPLCHLSFHVHGPDLLLCRSQYDAGEKERHRDTGRMPVVQISPAAPVPVAVPQAEPAPAPVIRKRYNNPVTDFMLNALLKKE